VEETFCLGACACIGDLFLQKATEYHEHARECRALAANVSRPDHKAALIVMAETWESLARMRVLRVAKEIEKNTSPRF
jgi:hypothetical protein